MEEVVKLMMVAEEVVVVAEEVMMVLNVEVKMVVEELVDMEVMMVVMKRWR